MINFIKERLEKKMIRRKNGLLRLTLVTASILCLSGCGTKTQNGLSGEIQMAGSTSMEDMCVAVSEQFMEKEKGITVSAEYIGSSAGIEALLSGSADIGTSSRNLTDEEKNAGAVENIVAKDGIAVVLNPSVTGVENLDFEDLKNLFCGKVTNWSELGGPDMPVVIVGHEAGSGTRDPFEEILDIKDKCVYANELSGSGAVLIKVAETEGAVGYMSLALVDDTVKSVSVNEIPPTRENIQNGTYPLNKTMVMATKGKIEEQNEMVQALFDFVYSEEGQKLIDGVNLIPISRNK